MSEGAIPAMCNLLDCKDDTVRVMKYIVVKLLPAVSLSHADGSSYFGRTSQHIEDGCS